MISALLSFFGGTAFRMIWGELSAWLNKRQDHQHEIERLRLQADLDERLNLNDEALCKLADYCINMEGPKARLGEYELSEHYGDAVRRELAPLLVERLRAFCGAVACRFPARVVRVNTRSDDPPRTLLAWNGWEGDVHEEAFPLQDAEPGEMVEIVVLREGKPRGQLDLLAAKEAARQPDNHTSYCKAPDPSTCNGKCW